MSQQVNMSESHHPLKTGSSPRPQRETRDFEKKVSGADRTLIPHLRKTREPEIILTFEPQAHLFSLRDALFQCVPIHLFTWQHCNSLFLPDLYTSIVNELEFDEMRKEFTPNTVVFFPD